jgi:anti-sigma factor RsiW
MTDSSTSKELNLDKTHLQALSALVDNELSPSDRAALLEYAANDPRATDRIAHYRAQNAALKTLFPLPRENIRGIFLPLHVSWQRRVGVAAAWLSVGLLLGLAPRWLNPYFFAGQPAFAKNAAIAYSVYAPERRHPVEVAAADEKHLINWLSKRLDRPLSIPSLREYGYTLMGGRLLPGEFGPAAQFMYEDKTGKRLTLYITAALKHAAAIRMLPDDNGQDTFYWVSKGMGYALSGHASEAYLRSMAIDVCGALGGNPQTWQ